MNLNLNRAKKNRNDEFYTRYADVENELKHYSECFKDKIVYCPCDDEKSAFTQYFINNFNDLNLKKLICTSLNRNGKGKLIVYDGELHISELNNDGDFRSDECSQFFDECNYVITNPPFSLFRQLHTILREHKNNFILLGTLPNLLLKDIFPFIQSNEYHLGVNNGTFNFYISEQTEIYGHDALCYDENGSRMLKLSNIIWINNFKKVRHNPSLTLTKTYSPEVYQKFDNYDAINVNKIKDIPEDYDGLMGVPVTYLLKRNDEQFELVWIACAWINKYHDNDIKTKIGFDYSKTIQSGGDPFVNGKAKFSRILIKKITKK